ncbi:MULTISPECIES: DUF3667 domain-containing protein [unclassified Massilia]|uniref:DUF3667 domain-containing protein n=1 Tax=unclassified Massilia TaxID=2609279 RepID=UPI001B833A67|nr:DUF3667 domain-containing protein [Massilia sp. AB1]MBQ5961479.1 DUF3667 domain-containing protein [Massilia sp. ZL223]
MKTEALPHPDTSICKNCGAATSGNFCHQCGQATHLHVPTAFEFLHEFVGHYVALEGKLWKSLKLLLFKPGFLTREYIEGRRARYLEPLRVYLTFSIIFFALFKIGGLDFNVMSTDRDELQRAAVEQVAKDKVARPATPEELAQVKESEKDLVEIAGRINPALGRGTEGLLDMPEKERSDALKRAFFSNAPYAVFALMPVFALFLKILYLGKGRTYGEHFLFALHSNAFAFFMLSLLILVPKGWDIVTLVLLLWLTFYLPTAMRRVYGGTRTMTAVRWLVLMMLHTISLSMAVVAAVSQAFLQ